LAISTAALCPLEEYLAEQEAAGFNFYEGKEPWLKGYP
jgi:hypothetical protein